ncbi:MAG: DoxX family protein [Acidobacteriia bacterium]|nr:DoxX family protein [Terriglobia bacterium]
MKLFGKLQPVALLMLRLALGIIFFTHGYPKLAGASAGYVAFFAQHGLPGYLAYVSGVLEVFGSILLVLGLFTRVTAGLLAVEMGVAIWKVHMGKGYLAVREYEFALVMGAACLALASVGAGMLSLDRPLFKDKSGK